MSKHLLKSQLTKDILYQYLYARENRKYLHILLTPHIFIDFSMWYRLNKFDVFNKVVVHSVFVNAAFNNNAVLLNNISEIHDSSTMHPIKRETSSNQGFYYILNNTILLHSICMQCLR